MTVSVVIPAYNAAKYLERSLRSAFSQTRKPDEVIVVDDGSTDETATVATRLGAKCLSIANRGVSNARNIGISAATSDWVAFLDADDWWAPEKLERQIAAISDNAVLIYSGFYLAYIDGRRTTVDCVPSALAKRELLWRQPILISTTLVRRDALLRLGGFNIDLNAAEDWECWVRLTDHGDFVGVSEPLTFYQITPNSLSSDVRLTLEYVRTAIPTLLGKQRGIKRLISKCRILSCQYLSVTWAARKKATETN